MHDRERMRTMIVHRNSIRTNETVNSTVKEAMKVNKLMGSLWSQSAFTRPILWRAGLITLRSRATCKLDLE